MILMLSWTIQLYAMFFVAEQFLIKHRNAKRGTWQRFFWEAVVVIYGIIFIIADVVYDIIVGSIWFMQIPRYIRFDWGIFWRTNKTFTSRLKHVKLNESGWRYDLAVDFCNLINKIQADHC